MKNTVKELRNRAKITMKELSDKTGIGLSTISNYENGYSNPKTKNAIKLADYFGVSVSYLLGLSDVVSEVKIQRGDYVRKDCIIDEVARIRKERRLILEKLLLLEEEEENLLRQL